MSSTDTAGLVDGRFYLERRVGSGGAGTVYRARDELDGSIVALKIMVSDWDDTSRFTREAEILADLRHPGIVRHVAHGTTAEGAPYVAMEWLEGADLSEVLAQRKLHPSQCLTLARRVAEALGFAHARGIVHRDVKPGNLFVVEDDVERVKLIDFGIARVSRADQTLTRTGMILGTPAYMAPEQIQAAGAPSPAADVFSLGCVLYQCLTGKPAFEGSNLMARLAKILLQEPPSLRAAQPDAPLVLDALLTRMLAKNPAERPPNGAAVAAEIARIEGQGTGWSAAAANADVTLTSVVRHRSAFPALTRDEQRLVTVVLAGDPDDASTGPAPRSQDTATELQSAIAPYGGRVAAIGGGPLIVTVWGGDSALDRAERAAQCALSLRARFPDMPVSISTGRGRVAAQVVEGDMLDQAVRALRGTPRGMVRLDALTADMLHVRFHVEAQGETIFLREERAPEDGATLLLGKASPCVGRNRELTTLDTLLASVVEDGAAAAVIVSGPPGAGKSRLGRELTDKVQQRGDAVTILSGRGSSTSAGSPFWVLSDVIRRAAGIRDGDPPPVRREKLAARIGRHVKGAQRASVVAFLGAMIGTPFPDAGEAVRAAAENPMLLGDSMRAAFQDWLAAELHAHPVLLLLEDLHAGDPATVSLIDATLRRLHDRPLMVLALARSEVHAHYPALWAGRGAQTIRLAPLGRRASERLVAQALGDAEPAVIDRIVDHAGGNPFYLEELIRAVAGGRTDAFPDSLLGSIEARLDAEGPEAKRILRAASVFGERFSRDGAAALLGGSSSREDVGIWLELLANRELIASVSAAEPPGDVDYVFRPALVREAAYAMLIDADRTLGHALAGAWLEQTGHADDMAIAEHFRRGDQPARAVRWYRRAAEHALAANAFDAALERVALGVASGAEGDDLGALGVVEVETYLWRGELGRALDRSRDVTRLFRPGAASWFRAVGQAATAAGKLGDFESVERWIEPAISAAVEDGASGARIGCLAGMATHLVFGGRYDAADAVLRHLDEVAGDPRRLDARAVADLYGVRAIRATVAGDLGAGLEGFRATLIAFEQMGNQRDAASIRCNIGYVLGELGDFASAEEALRGALEAAERMGLHDLATAALSNLGRVVAHRGRIEEARALEERALEAYLAHGDPRMAGVARTYLAQIALLAGDPAEAEREARDAAEALRVAPPLRAGALAVLAQSRLAQGRAGEALEAAREAFAQLEELGSIEEGESLVRLAYAEALAAAEADPALAAAAASGAFERLRARASKISDPAWRQHFVHGVPENARTLELVGLHSTR